MAVSWREWDVTEGGATLSAEVRGRTATMAGRSRMTKVKLRAAPAHFRTSTCRENRERSREDAGGRARAPECDRALDLNIQLSHFEICQPRSRNTLPAPTHDHRLNLAVLPIFGRCEPGEPCETSARKSSFRETQSGCQSVSPIASASSTGPGAIHPAGNMVTMRRHAEGLFEGARKVKEAQLDESASAASGISSPRCSSMKSVTRSLLPHRQAATKRPRCDRWRSLQADEFVDQHEAQGLRILPAPRTELPTSAFSLSAVFQTA